MLLGGRSVGLIGANLLGSLACLETAVAERAAAAGIETPEEAEAPDPAPVNRTLASRMLTPIGRIGRLVFLLRVIGPLAAIVVSQISLQILTGVFGYAGTSWTMSLALGLEYLAMFLAVAGIWALICQIGQRMHDYNLPTWYVVELKWEGMMYLTPGYAVCFFGGLMVWPGHDGANAYGPGHAHSVAAEPAGGVGG